MDDLVLLSCHCGQLLAVPATMDDGNVLHLDHTFLAEHLSGHDERRTYTAADRAGDSCPPAQRPSFRVGRQATADDSTKRTAPWSAFGPEPG